MHDSDTLNVSENTNSPLMRFENEYDNEYIFPTPAALYI